MAPSAGTFDAVLVNGGSITDRQCGSGRLTSTAIAAGKTSLLRTSQGTSRQAFAALLGANRPSVAPAAGVVAFLEAETCSLLQTVAVGPAVLDAALQMGDAGQLAAAVEAVLLGGAAALGSHSRLASASSSSTQIGSDNGALAVQLRGITDTPLVGVTQQHAPAAAAVQVDMRPAGMLYSIFWEAAAPIDTCSAASANGLVLAGGKRSGAAEAISVAQAVLKQAAGSISADLAGSLMPAPTPGAIEAAGGAAALQGVLKALAHEAPAMSLAVSSITRASATSQTAAPWMLSVEIERLSSTRGSDAHGVAISSGASFLPRLLPKRSAAGSGIAEGATGSGHDSFIVTGGSGVLGGYVALWLLQQGAQSVLLLSRTGGVPDTVLHQQQQLYADASPASSISSSKVDAALVADVEALLTTGSSIRGIMHAGGVLADSTLPNQTLAGIRQAREAARMPSTPC